MDPRSDHTKQAASEQGDADDLSYQAITAMLGSYDQLHEDTDNALAEPYAATAQAQPPADLTDSHMSSPFLAESAAANAQAGQAEHLDIIAFPSVPVSRLADRSNSDTAAATPETEEALFERLTALKAKDAVPKEDFNALTDRLTALKGPKVSAAELQDLHSRLNILKGSHDPVSMSELEGRLAKLKSSCSASQGKLIQLKGRADGEVVPDLDPDVELNQDQLEALAGMNGKDTNIADLADTMLQMQQHSMQQGATAGTEPSCVTAAAHANLPATDLQQLLQGFDPDGEDALNAQQLQALAGMQTEAQHAVPKWAAALGLSPQDLHGDTTPEASQHGSVRVTSSRSSGDSSHSSG